MSRQDSKLSVCKFVSCVVKQNRGYLLGHISNLILLLARILLAIILIVCPSLMFVCYTFLNCLVLSSHFESNRVAEYGVEFRPNFKDVFSPGCCCFPECSIIDTLWELCQKIKNEKKKKLFCLLQEKKPSIGGLSKLNGNYFLFFQSYVYPSISWLAAL